MINIFEVNETNKMIEKENLDNEAFKDKIIAALKGEDHD